jgi:hypothetical protein
MRRQHQEEAEQTNAEDRRKKPFPQRLVPSLAHLGITMTYGSPKGQCFRSRSTVPSIKTEQTS